MEEEYKQSDNQEKSLKEELNDLKEIMLQQKQGSLKKSKPFKLPRGAKLSNVNLRDGYVSVMVINENDTIELRKEPVIGSTIKLDDTFHAIQGSDILSYKGKPLVIIPKIKKNPFNPNYGNNETFGQKQIMNRMLNEALPQKKKIGGMPLAIGALVIGGFIIYALLSR